MPTIQDHLDLASVLAFIVTATGKVSGRLRIQKLMYLLQQKGAKPLEPFFFEYHHYGPFSAEVADVIKGAVRSQLVAEREEGDDEWKRYEYTPTPHASQYADRVDPETRTLVQDVLATCNDAHWRTLELAATVDFLQRTDNLDLEAAVQEALERKPQCAQYEAEARHLLQALKL